MLKQHYRPVCFLSLTILFILSLGIGGCGDSSDTTSEATGDPVVTVVARPTGTRLSPGQQVAIAAEVVTISEVEFEWTSENGELSSKDGQSVIYTAPDTPGLFNVDVVVTNNTGRTTRSVTFEVIVTPTPPPTEEPTTTPTEMSTATSTAGPTPTPEPFIAITIPGPNEQIECTGKSTCSFTITGVSTVSNSTYKIVPFVNPIPGNSNTWLPQPEHSLDSETWQAEVQIGADDAIEPGHHFEIVTLIIDASTHITEEFQSLPSAVAQSKIADALITSDRKISLTIKEVTPTKTPSSIVITTSTPVSPTPSCDQSLRFRLVSPVEFSGQLEILTPKNCRTGLPTESPILVSGTYENIPTDVDIWVLVFPPNLVYYVQSSDACQGAKMTWQDGQWQVPVYLGQKGGLPEWHDIVVVLADQEASRFLSDWVKNGCISGPYKGLQSRQLEQMNITEKNFITVQTLD